MITAVLLNNGYPIQFISRHMKARVLQLVRASGQSPRLVDPSTGSDDRAFFTIPYVSGVSEQFIRVVDGDRFRMAYRPARSLMRFICVHKDKLDRELHMNVVYKIDCRDCSASYVGQTGRKLATRIKEHVRVCNPDLSGFSSLTEHRLDYNHEFNWNDVTILDNETHYYKRLISEAIHIKLQNNGLNAQTDSDMVNDCYLSVLDVHRRV